LESSVPKLSSAALNQAAGGVRLALSYLRAAWRGCSRVVGFVLFEGDPRLRRLRAPAFVGLGLAAAGAAALATLAFGSVALVRFDPLRVLSIPLSLPSPETLAARDGAFAQAAQTSDWRAELLGLKARASALGRPNTEMDALSAGAARLLEIAAQQRKLASSLGQDGASAASLDGLAQEASQTTADSARKFAEGLALGLEGQIREDTDRLNALEADGWSLGADPVLRALAAARGPLRELRSAAAGAKDPETAIAIADRIADVGAGLARVRAPITRTDQAIAARQAFAEIDAQVLALIQDLRDRAEDRPWLFAGEERRRAYAEARMRWSQIAPLVEDLAQARSLAFASRDPSTIQAAVLRAYSLRSAILETLNAPNAAAAPEEPNPVTPAPQIGQALQLAQEAANAANRSYRQAFDLVEPLVGQDYRRRKDRRTAQALRQELTAMYERVQRLDDLERSLLANATPETAQSALAEVPRLRRAIEEHDERINRLARALQ